MVGWKDTESTVSEKLTVRRLARMYENKKVNGASY